MPNLMRRRLTAGLAVLAGGGALESVLALSNFALFDGLRIGRGEDNDVVVADGRASRRHARIVADRDGFAIEDAGSSNGTFVDGGAVERARLHPGASIVVGETVLEIRG